MSSPSPKRRRQGDKKVRVSFRRNRSVRRRRTDWTKTHREQEERAIDAETGERLAGKGDLSRRRTVTVRDESAALPEGLHRGTVVAMRGLYADVDDGQRVWPCTVRRVLRTRLVEERHPVTVGDHVLFHLDQPSEGVVQEGVIEVVLPRSGQLRRRVRRRIQTLVANVDQVLIVSSADQPTPKPHLIDRYIVAAHAGDIAPVVCMNKLDLDEGGAAKALLDRYAHLGYATLYTSAVTGAGIESLRDTLQDKASVIAGQSGVGKSSLLNVLQPGLELAIGAIIEQTAKGKHTTSTATLIRLDAGGYVVDTPGIRSFDLSTIPRGEFEAYFVEFLDHVPNCKFPDCTHTHEDGCAVVEAVDSGDIHPERYESYVRLFTEPAEPEWERKLGE
jgi:ribosome biogenesis GTPase